MRRHSEKRKLYQLLQVTNVLKDMVKYSDNESTTKLEPVPVDALPPTVAIRLDKVRGQSAGNSVAVAGENMALGFSLLQDGDNVLARVCDRHLPVRRGQWEAPACHRWGCR